MKYLFNIVIVATVGLLAGNVFAANTMAHVGTYNLILKEDLTYNSHIGGKTLIGGDVTSGSLAEVGAQISDPGVDAVTVLGDIAGFVRAQNGTNILYGSKTGTTANNDGGTSTQIADMSAAQANFDSIWNQAVADSLEFKTLSSTGGFDTSDFNNKRFLNDNALALNVFNIDASDIVSGGGFQFATNLTVPVIINVAGTGTINIGAKAMGNFGKTNAAPLVLWNFYQAEQITFADGWNGSLLAPYAHINLSTGSFDGGLVALSLTSDKQLHNELYTYQPPSTPPTEASAPAGLLFIALGLCVMLRRRFMY